MKRYCARAAALSGSGVRKRERKTTAQHFRENWNFSYLRYGDGQKHKKTRQAGCSSASTTAVCMRVSKEFAHCCKRLGLAKSSSKTHKKFEKKILEKCDKFSTAAIGARCFAEVRTRMTAACFVVVVLYPRRLDQSEIFFQNWISHFHFMELV